MPDGDLHAGIALREALGRAGIAVEEGVEVSHGPLPPGKVLARWRSAPLADWLPLLLTDSQNWYAEMLLRVLAAQVGEGRSDEGLRVVREMLELEVGIETGAVAQDDASGLSPFNLTTPRAVARLLEWSLARPWKESFVGALATPGKGTLATWPALPASLAAKTGTLQNALGLAGYLSPRGPQPTVFVIFWSQTPAGRGDLRRDIANLVGRWATLAADRRRGGALRQEDGEAGAFLGFEPGGGHRRQAEEDRHREAVGRHGHAEVDQREGQHEDEAAAGGHPDRPVLGAAAVLGRGVAAPSQPVEPEEQQRHRRADRRSPPARAGRCGRAPRSLEAGRLHPRESVVEGAEAAAGRPIVAGEAEAGAVGHQPFVQGHLVGRGLGETHEAALPAENGDAAQAERQRGGGHAEDLPAPVVERQQHALGEQAEHQGDQAGARAAEGDRREKDEEKQQRRAEQPDRLVEGPLAPGPAAPPTTSRRWRKAPRGRCRARNGRC